MLVVHGRCLRVLRGVSQGATMNAIASGTLANVGSQLLLGGHLGPGAALLSGSAVFGVFIGLAFRRVKRIDKFERGMRG